MGSKVSPESKTLRVRATLLFVLLAGATLTGTWFLWPRPPTLMLDARSARESLERFDGAGLYRYLWDKEIQELHLTPRKVHTVLNEVLKPRLQKYRPTDRMEENVHGGGAQGTSDRIYVDSSGRELTIMSTANLTENGGKVLLSDVIRLAWYAEYVLPGLQKGEYASRLQLSQGWLRGLDADQAKLASMGIEGWVSQPPRDKLRPWAEVRSKLMSTISEETLKQAPSNRP